MFEQLDVGAPLQVHAAAGLHRAAGDERERFRPAHGDAHGSTGRTARSGRRLVAFAPHQPRCFQAVDQQFVAAAVTIDRVAERRDELRFALQPEQVVAQMIAEGAGVLGGARRTDRRRWTSVLLATM